MRETQEQQSMRLHGPDSQPVQDESCVIDQLLSLRGARVLDLGCGAAEKTRQIAEQYEVAEIVAAEVDRIQHQKNLQIDDLPNVRFESFGAQAIAAMEASFDVVVMFKSLHHVPVADMDVAHSKLQEPAFASSSIQLPEVQIPMPDFVC